MAALWRGPGAWAAVLCGAALGTALQLQRAALPGWGVHVVVALAGALAVLLSVAWARRGARWAWLGLLLATAALAWTATGARALWFERGALAAELEGRDLTLVGVVASLPRLGERGPQFEFSVESAHEGGQPVAVPAAVSLSWSAGFPGAAPTLPLPDVKPGQRWRLTVRLQRPHGLANPQGFDAELWFWERGLQASGYVRRGRGAAPELLAQTWRYPIEQARHAVRERLRQQVAEPRTAGVLLALLAGDQAAIAAPDWDVFRITGVAHLVSVSGVHVTMFAWLAVRLLGWGWCAIGRRRPGLLLAVPVPVAASVGGVVLAALYAAFAGWGVPSQRTVLMLAAITVLRLQGRRWPWPMVWLLALNAVVWLDPWALLQAGFWLSFVAVGVLFAAGDPASATAERPGWRQQLAALWRTQAIVTVALAPLTLMLFGQFSLVGLLANLWAIPWVTLVVTPLAMLGALLPGVWTLGGWATDLLLWGLHAMAPWPLAVVERPALPGALALLAVLGGVLLVQRWPWELRAWGLLLLWPALAYQPPRPAPGQFELLAPDVGQGTALVVRTARHTLVYDTGPPQGAGSDAAQRVLLPLLRAAGERPDGVMISHNDSDHASGAGTLARAFPRAQWWASFDLSAQGVAAERCVAGQRWIWDGVEFEVLHPNEADFAAGLSDNAMSCVLRIGGDGGALLTGDITLAEETRLALARPELRTALLVLAHHGSHTSSGPVWLNTLRPAWALIQAGHRSRYGHPAPIVLRRLQARGIPWVASPACGAATWHSAAPDEVTCQRDQARRYWHHPDPARSGNAAMPVE